MFKQEYLDIRIVKCSRAMIAYVEIVFAVEFCSKRLQFCCYLVVTTGDLRVTNCERKWKPSDVYRERVWHLQKLSRFNYNQILCMYVLAYIHKFAVL